MKLYIMRHAEAESAGGAIATDADRRLTSRGYAQAEEVANHLIAQKAGHPLIFCSPLVRTHQTADVLAGVLGQKKPVQSSSLLVPQSAAPPIDQLLKDVTQDTIIIGHQPDMLCLCIRLLGSVSNSLHFPPAGIAALDYQGIKKPSQLLWSFIPSACP